MATAKKDAAPKGERSGAKPANGDPGGAPPPGQDSSEDPTAFILSRARSEVHLLLDNISANPEVTIAALSAQTKPRGLSKEWIKDVCEITWPPKDSQATSDQMAKQAALLIKTRDYLNSLAKPASGATIAFTLMVTQEARLNRRRRRAASGAPRTPSRTSLAEEAYPDLVERARGFRTLLAWTLWSSVGVLLLTLLISWYLAVGNAALTDYAAARAELILTEARVGAAQSGLSDNREAPEEAAPPSAQPAAQQPAQAAVQQTPVSRALPAPAPPARSLQALSSAAPADRYLFYPCLRRDSYPSSELRDACLARKVHAEHFLAVRRGLDEWAPFSGPDTAGWWANLLGSGVLPVLYGFLGAIASVVRSLSRKIKASLLSPRDIQLTFQQLALGAVVGACISLFIAAPGGGSNDASLLGPVALSTSAIAFVAGFGVDSVFQALEALISRIFNIAPAGMSARREAKPGT